MWFSAQMNVDVNIGKASNVHSIVQSTDDEVASLIRYPHLLIIIIRFDRVILQLSVWLFVARLEINNETQLKTIQMDVDDDNNNNEYYIKRAILPLWPQQPKLETYIYKIHTQKCTTLNHKNKKRKNKIYILCACCARTIGHTPQIRFAHNKIKSVRICVSVRAQMRAQMSQPTIKHLHHSMTVTCTRWMLAIIYDRVLVFMLPRLCVFGDLFFFFVWFKFCALFARECELYGENTI